ncbi:Platelet-derived growth factor receptor beta [Takifugu flavidus]|uniref:Platelet-derived growth factor receptor-like protein n=1 Tax=Takifugu flavidus TaxID=433684 RepID=A0A5C6MJK6_9TELE|nr:Platelet-derived growth factor receptor beta [Takifugu flavidus]
MFRRLGREVHRLLPPVDLCLSFLAGSSMLRASAMRAAVLHLTVALAALLSSCTTVSCLKIVPEEKQLILAEGSSLSLTCAGSSETTWDLKSDDVPFFQMKAESSGLNYKIVQSNSTASVLTLWHVDWKNTGVYQCREQLTGEIKEVAVFVPDPEVWFIESSHGMVTKTSGESTVPCVVTNPNIMVTLYDKDTDLPVNGVYVPSEGFKAYLDYRTYVCRGELNGVVKESQAFNVYSIHVPEDIDAYVNASQTVLKQGEPLTVNCTVQGVELVLFSWDIPNRDIVKHKPETVVLSATTMRSCLVFPHATVAHSGTYVCHAHESTQDQKAFASVNITVLERGFVAVKSTQKQNITAELQENVELRVEIEAYPPPQIRWKKDGAPVRGDKTIIIRQEHEIRYVTILTLVRVRTEQKGLYTALITNEDDVKEVTFALEVQVLARIKDLTDHHLPGKKQLVTCVAEGVPTPTIQWYSCDSMLKCNNQTSLWQQLKADPELLSIHTSVTEARRTNQVQSQVTFFKPQHTTVRCETTNQEGLIDFRDVKLVSSSLFSQVVLLAVVLTLVPIIIMSIIILIAVWKKAKGRYRPLYLVTEYCRYGDLVDYLHRNKHTFLQYYLDKNQDDGSLISGGSTPLSQRKGYVSFGSESDGGYMDMSKDEPAVYVPMQEQMDTIKYADIQPSPYESPYQQDLYQEQGGGRVDLVISDSPALTYDDLLGFSYQVAKGMEFLASKNATVYYKAVKIKLTIPPLYEIMKRCWDETFEKRPDFSFLVHCVGDMLTDSYKKKYSQVNETFLKSDHPAVARTKPRLSSPFPIANPAFGSPSLVGLSDFPDPYNQNTRHFRNEAEVQEGVTSFNEYIIPIPDPKPEEAFTDVPSESPESSLALEEETDSVHDSTDTLPEEDRLEETSERDALLGSSGTPEVEDSFL